MAKSSSLEAKLETIESLRSLPPSAEIQQTIKNYLVAKNNFLVAKAARVASEHGYTGLIPELLAAFERFLQNALKTDKSCLAKTAIIKALHTLQHADAEIFLQGIRYFQYEPAFGGDIDTAGEIRSMSAFALVDIGYRDVLYELITLTVDSEVQVRINAARALANTGTHEAELILRLLVTHGSRDLSVTGECLSGLMQLAPTQSFELVSGYLESPHDELRQAAALALAETHSLEAFETLRNDWNEHPFQRDRRLLILPFAVLTRPVAISFLLTIIDSDEQQIAMETINALKIYKHDPELVANLESIIQKKNSKNLQECYRRSFI
jgi:HEAT repeat protein